MTFSHTFIFLHSNQQKKKILDQRSALSKEACSVISSLAAVLGDDFEPLAEFFIGVLFKMVTNSINVLSENAHQCIISIIRKCHKLDRSIPLICNSATSSHNVLRTKAMEYLKIALMELPTSAIEKFAANIEFCISKGVIDALPDARTSARQCYWRYHTHLPFAAQKLFSAFEATTLILNCCTLAKPNLILRSVGVGADVGFGSIGCSDLRGSPSNFLFFLSS